MKKLEGFFEGIEKYSKILVVLGGGKEYIVKKDKKKGVLISLPMDKSWVGFVKIIRLKVGSKFIFKILDSDNKPLTNHESEFVVKGIKVNRIKIKE